MTQRNDRQITCCYLVATAARRLAVWICYSTCRFHSNRS